LAALMAAAGAASGCVGVFADDGSSISLGTHARGALLRGVELPDEGAGYRVPAPWRERHRQYGTEEMVRWLTGAFGHVATELPGSVAPVGDLSRQGGGRSFEHKSHGSGRDVDIFYYAMDPEGHPLLPDRAMFRFGPSGNAVAWSRPSPPRQLRHGRFCRIPTPLERLDPLPAARFDARRNWALVRALLSDPTVEVQWIFIHRALADLMLREGPTSTDDPALVARAAALMHQPADAQPHDDHMHIRVYCEPSDRALGCLDRGPQRWWKKRWKDLAASPGAPALAGQPMDSAAGTAMDGSPLPAAPMAGTGMAAAGGASPAIATTVTSVPVVPAPVVPAGTMVTAPAAGQSTVPAPATVVSPPAAVVSPPAAVPPPPAPTPVPVQPVPTASTAARGGALAAAHVTRAH
jgi:penicillin-insensitive murein endopeptidase